MMVQITLLAMGGHMLPATAQAQGSDRAVKVGGKVALNNAQVRGMAIHSGGERIDEGQPIDFRAHFGYSIGALVAVKVHPNLTFPARTHLLQEEVRGERESSSCRLFYVLDQPRRFFAMGGATFSVLTRAERTRFNMGAKRSLGHRR